MNKKIIGIIVLAIIVILGILCYSTTSTAPTNKNTSVGQPTIGMPNPADKFCVDNGATLSTVTTSAGESANCRFPNGQVCDSWALYRGECAIDGVVNVASYASSTSPATTVTANYRVKSGTLIINSKALNLNYVELKSAMSASGARYLTADGTIEFWEHQGEATISVNGAQIFVGKKSAMTSGN